MKRVYDFLKEAKVYYLATMDGDQARVRPFGTIDLFDGKLYIMTKNRKKVSDQMKANPKVEITAMRGDDWIRDSAGGLCSHWRINAIHWGRGGFPISPLSQPF